MLLLSLAVLLLRGAPDVRAAEDELFDDVKKDVKVKILSPADAPKFKASDDTSPGKISWQNKWLIISIEFEPAKPEKGAAWLADVTMDVEVLIEIKRDKDKEWRLFTGTSEFWAIHRDGRKHVAAMFIPPQILDRYLRDTVHKGDSFVRVRFNNGEWAYERNAAQKAFEEDFIKASPKEKKTFPDVVLPRNLTPWAVVDVDKYDLLKPASVAFGFGE